MQPASSADKPSPVLAFQNASARTRSRAEFPRVLSRAQFPRVGDAYLHCANAPTLNESPTSFSHPIAHANTAAPTSEPNRPTPKSFTPTRSENNVNAHARARATKNYLVGEEFCKSAQNKYNYRAQEANNHMTYGLAALAIGGLTVGCASALGAGLVPLAVVASVLILATVGVGVVAVSALGAGSSIPSPSPIGAGSNSSQISSTTSLGGVSC